MSIQWWSDNAWEMCVTLWILLYGWRRDYPAEKKLSDILCPEVELKPVQGSHRWTLTRDGETETLRWPARCSHREFNMYLLCSFGGEWKNGCFMTIPAIFLVPACLFLLPSFAQQWHGWGCCWNWKLLVNRGNDGGFEHVSSECALAHQILFSQNPYAWKTNILVASFVYSFIPFLMAQWGGN